jgi:hypothetical protein
MFSFRFEPFCGETRAHTAFHRMIAKAVYKAREFGGVTNVTTPETAAPEIGTCDLYHISGSNNALG